ncbi:MAG: ClbS/DfsB family four-helix bundle protein [Chloroflexi bacterium]|nr:ClbS/DfsB family four-helix bundle protein [Chloroflexota bacterium]
MTGVAPSTDRLVDLRRASLTTLRAIDFRSATRDYWADEAAIDDRFVAVWAGLDDAAWRLPGAAPSDAGGPDWSLLDHVAHVIDWWELAIGYIGDVVRGMAWPTDDDFYQGGDFNALNEVRRAQFAGLAPADLRARGATAHARVVAIARQLPLETIRSDAAWGWVHQVLHGHALDHLTVLEPWAAQLRERQVRNDPFDRDPQPQRATLAGDLERFWTAEAAVMAQLTDLLATVPDEAWPAQTDGDWTLADHVAHIAGWFDEGAKAIEAHRDGGPWADVPAEGLEAWNDRQVRAARGTSPVELRQRFADGLARLRAATEAMTDDEWLDPEGFSWAYEDLHGHVRAHLAMIGPWVARVGWPAPGPGDHPGT